MGNDLNRQEQDIKNRQHKATMTIIAGMALVVIGFAGGMVSAGAGILAAVAGIGIAIYGGQQSWQIEQDTVDLKARQSSDGLVQSLQAQGVSLTPVQQAAIQSAEYQKTKEEWQDRIKAVRQASSTVHHGN